MILEPSQLSSLKPFKEIFSKDFCKKVEDEISNYYKIHPISKKNKYIVEGITSELQIGNLDDSEYIKYKEQNFNEIISIKLKGKGIPQNGFYLNTVAVILPPNRNEKILDFDLGLPLDRNQESSIRLWVADDNKSVPQHLQRTIVYSVPFKFLSSKIENDKSHPPRGDFWVYRVRFYITDKDRFDQGTINCYQNGYVGFTSQTPFERFNQHYYGKTKGLEKKLYNGWSLIDEHKINHIVSFEILERCNTKEEALELERYHIKELDSYRNGFNATQGGESGDKFVKSTIGEENIDSENREDYLSKLPGGNKKPHIVKSHYREFKPGKLTLIPQHFRCLPKEAEEHLGN